MSVAADFVVSLAQAVSNLGLYPPGHPAREQAVDRAYERMVRFQEAYPTARFTFLEELTVLGRRPVRSLRDWDWSRRLWEVGLQRLELVGPVARDELAAFLDEVQRRLSGRPGPAAGLPPQRLANLRYGAIGLRDEQSPDGPARPAGVVTFSLREEFDAVEWIQQEVRHRRPLPVVEAETVVRSLALAMRGDRDYLVPLLRLKGFDYYGTTHAINVAVLAMALAEHLGLGEADVRALGLAGLLHDLGMVSVPTAVLTSAAPLGDGGRRLVQAHTAEGARRILDAAENLDLAAIVAYEHHLRRDGRGYPQLTYPRRTHPAAELIQVCDVFDALRSKRPYRDAWELERALQLLERGAGREFDPDIALAFVRMRRTLEPCVAQIEDRSEPLLVAGHEPDVENDDQLDSSPDEADDERDRRSDEADDGHDRRADTDDDEPRAPGDLDEPRSGPNDAR